MSRKKTLIYHILDYPSEMLELNFHLLREYFCFDKAIISIARIGEISQITRNFVTSLPCKPTVYVHNNDNFKGEGYTFLRKIKDSVEADSNSISFYAHTKGSSSPKGTQKYNEYGKAIEAWAEAMYRLNLSNPVYVENILNSKKSFGILRTKGDHYGSSWHYSGSFFWFNNSINSVESYDKNLDCHVIYPGSYYVSESWPGRVISFEDSFSPFDRNKDNYKDAIDPQEYEKILEDIRNFK